MENPKKLTKLRLNCFVPGVCSALFGALLVVDMYLDISGRRNIPLGWTAFFALGASLVYSACAWSRLTFAMSGRLPWFTGLPFFAAALFPIWAALWFAYILANMFADVTERMENLSWWALFALLAAAWLIQLTAVAKSLGADRRAPRPAPPEAAGTPDLKKIKRRRTATFVGAGAVLLLMAAGLYWHKFFLEFVIPRMDWEGRDVFDMLRMYKLTRIRTGIALTLALTWALYAWNLLMLEAGRHFIVQLVCDLAATGFFSVALFLLIFDNHSFIPLLPFACGAAVMAADALLTLRIKAPAKSPDPENDAHERV